MRNTNNSNFFNFPTFSSDGKVWEDGLEDFDFSYLFQFDAMLLNVQ